MYKKGESMLTVYLGKDYLFMDNKISEVSDYFDSWYEDARFTDDMCKRIVKEIDDVEYLGRGNAFISEEYGVFSSRELSSGSKALMLLWNRPDLLISGDRMGDNYVPLLFEIAKQKDIKITLCHAMEFIEPFEFFCEPVHRMVTSEDDFYELWKQFRPELNHAYDFETKTWVDMAEEYRRG